jgi:tetraacyldisaccharide 4'-kinase
LDKLVNWLVYFLFVPIALLYKAGISIRNKCYDRGLFTSHNFGIPIISIGNITVGGTGKTPHTEYLIDILRKDFHIAVLSRGYKRTSNGFQYVETDDSISKTGDEPLQIKRKYPDIVVAVDADRVRGIKRLMSDGHSTDLILLDDAFQHRRVRASLNIVLIDYNRPVWKDCMLPAGRLRDCLSSLYRADIIVLTKCPANMSQDEKLGCLAKLEKYNKPIYFSHYKSGEAYPLSGSDKSAFDASHLLALSGIANPAVFLRQLEKQYPEAIIEQIVFPDHHNFSDGDVRHILTKAQLHTIVTTEKDGVRLISCFRKTRTRIPEHIYCIPIKVMFDDSKSFNINIYNHVRQNKKNSGFYQN